MTIFKKKIWRKVRANVTNLTLDGPWNVAIFHMVETVIRVQRKRV